MMEGSKVQSAKSVLRVKGEVVRRSVAGEILLIPIRGRVADLQRIFAVDPVGDFVWQRLDGMASLREIAEALCGAFDVDPEAAEADVCAFAGELIGAGLVEPVSPHA